MPRNSEKNQYYTEGFERGTRVHRLIEEGAGGHTGGEFIKMLVEDVDRLMHGEPAVVLSGLLASARISLQTGMGSLPPMEPAAPPPDAAPTLQTSALSRAARARRSYSMDDDDEEDEEES